MRSDGDTRAWSPMVPSVLVCVWGCHVPPTAFVRIVVTVVLLKTDSVRGATVKAKIQGLDSRLEGRREGPVRSGILLEHKNRSKIVQTSLFLLLRQYHLL